jgi:glutamate synthase (NADPH) small chain
VRGLRLAQTILGEPPSPGAVRPFYPQAEQFELKADLIVLALGFDPQACPATEEFNELRTNDWGGLVVDDRQMTSLPGVFAGGDLVRGPTTLLYAVRDGRSAAEQIASYLGAKTRHTT